MAASTTTAKKATETAAKYTRLREAIEANIERIPSLVEAENADGVKELYEETDELIKQLPRAEHTKLRAVLNAAAKPAPKAEEKPASKAVAKKTAPAKKEVVKAKAWNEIEGVPQQVAAASKAVREAAMTSHKTGKAIAQMLLSIRLTITDENGVPDLQAKSQAARDAAAEVYNSITKGLPEEGTDAAADVVWQGIGDVKRSAQNYMGDVQVEYVRALDHSPEEAARWSAVIEKAGEGAKPTDAVAKFFDMKTLNTRAENYQIEKKAKAAIEAAQTAVKAAESLAAAALEEGDMTEEEAAQQIEEAKQNLAEVIAAAPEKVRPKEEANPADALDNALKTFAKLLPALKVEGIAGLDSKVSDKRRKTASEVRAALETLLGKW